MQAIHTKYIKPTSTKGPRVMAKCGEDQVLSAWDYELGTEANHRLAAALLCDLLSWPTERLITGALPDGSYCHVFAPRA